ncbi:eukaryotic translation initiation factor 3 subunit A-like [Tubulanus polymorphus]|uniref:eukaryotic translation initiation factor 3 subunit A-like n=1 Tax=Tubulanus polymorphus TaxID=672921 RepID=UPI003DA5BB7E
MPTYFQRPENALKRANEFIDVGKKQRALDALYDVIKSKKHRTWQKIHEPIMHKYLELCVDLKKSHVAKEGLYQYKNICQQVNIKSLEDVVKKYLSLAEERTEEARQTSHQAVIDIDDLDILQTPESLLLSAVSGEDTQDRTDRAILTPWVKFLWESYRQCLELLRNNNRVEKLYQDIAQQAFKFCLKYARKTEFRKLCDNLRTHLGHIHKHQSQQTAINLNNPESQAMHLETRLVQLDSAIQMELWQEAFKAVEDVHGLVSLSKKPPKPALMANYYEKLGLVFQKAGNQLFHASAWHRLYHLFREQRKSLSTEELQRISMRVLCATLSVPIPATRDKLDTLIDQEISTQDKQRRLATLLMLPNPPTRAGLIKDLVRYNICQNVPVELLNLYRWLEVDFHPLKLSQKIVPCLEYIGNNEELQTYVTGLQDIAIIRILKQVSQVYQSIQFSRLVKLCPFASEFRLERIVVESARTLDLQVRIDHRTRCLTFGCDLGVNSQKEEVTEGPNIQSMPSEHIRNQMVLMAEALSMTAKLIQPSSVKTVQDELRAHLVKSYHQVARRNHENVLKRQRIIEERKEELETISTQREQEEMMRMEEERRKKEEAELGRLQREMEERAQQRRDEEMKEIQRKVARERLDQLKKTDIGAKAFADIDEEHLAELDADEIVAKQVQQIEKEKKELMDKLRAQEKKIDYFARAKRVEELPLLKKQYDEESVTLKKFWEDEEDIRIKALVVEREQALEHRDRLRKIIPDKDQFLNELKASRKSVFKEKLKEFEVKLNEERKKRLLERKDRRKEERKLKYIKEKEEAKQRAKDEALKREREEQERLDLEKREREEKEYIERMEKLEEISARQKKREQEMEEKAARMRDQATGSRRDEDERPKGAWRPQPKEGGWRDKVKDRDDQWSRKTDAWSNDKSMERDAPEPKERAEPKERDESDKPSDAPTSAWRTPARENQDIEPRRDDRDFRRDDRDSFRRGDDRDSFRRGDDRDSFRRGDDRDSFRRGDDRDSFRRGSDRDSFRRDDRDSFRRGDDRDSFRRGDDRDSFRRGDDRDSFRRGDDRDSFRRGDDRDSFRRGDDRDSFRRGDDRDSFRRGDDRDSFRRGDDMRRGDREERSGGGGAWRSGGARDRDDDRRPPTDERRGFGDRWRDSPSGRGGDDGGSRWRRDGGRDSARESGPDTWRRGGAGEQPDQGSSPSKTEQSPWRGGGRPEEKSEEEIEGWTKVRR